MNTEWNVTYLSKICEIKTGKHDANHAISNGKYRFYTCASDFLKCDTKSFSGESVIVPGNGDIGLVFYYNGDFDAYQRTYVLQNITIDAKYLYYHMLLNWRTRNKNKQFGSTIRYVRMSNFSNYVISYPSLSEQQRIVDKIEELFSKLDKGVEELNKIKDQLKIYRQAVLKEAFEGIETYDYISSAFDVSGGLTKSSKRNSYPLKYNYIRVANVLYNAINTAEIKNIGVTTDEVEKTLLKKNDLLFVEGNGSKEQIGRVAIWNGEIENCLHQNHIIKARPLGNILSKFALYFLMSSFGRNQIIKIASSTSGLYTLSTNKIKNLFIPFADKLQQEETICYIEYRLSLCDKLEQTVNESLQKAESLRQSILKQAFEGKLT